jgi:predicted nucleic acid-binding Zn ribbon protein
VNEVSALIRSVLGRDSIPAEWRKPDVRLCPSCLGRVPAAARTYCSDRCKRRLKWRRYSARRRARGLTAHRRRAA